MITYDTSYGKYFVRVKTRSFEDYCKHYKIDYQFMNIDSSGFVGDSCLYMIKMSDEDALSMKLAYPTLGIAKITKTHKEYYD